MNLNTGSAGPFLIAHRGANAETPENTIAAFERALEFPINGIEFDVRLTRDEIPVVFHDETLERIAGRAGAISDYTCKELKAFDYGRWFSESFARTPIPTLEEVLDRYASRTALLIELKTGLDGPGHAEILRKLVRRSLELIDSRVPENGRSGVFILSFDREVLVEVHQTAPDLKCIQNIEAPLEEIPEDPQPYGFGLSLDRMTPTFVREAHRAGIKVMTYSCNTPARIDHALEFGIDYVLTDDPGSVSGYFRQGRIRV